jgi:hypothetical protein
MPLVLISLRSPLAEDFASCARDAQMPAARHSGAGVGAAAQAAEQSTAEQRQISCVDGSIGVGKRPRAAAGAHWQRKNAAKKQEALCCSNNP